MVQVYFFFGGKLINSFGGLGGKGEGGVISEIGESASRVDDRDGVVGFGGGLRGGIAERNFIFGGVRHEQIIKS